MCIRDSGKGVIAAGDKGKVFVSGYDAEPAEITLLREGVVNILVVQNPAAEGALAVQDAYDAVTGNKMCIRDRISPWLPTCPCGPTSSWAASRA